MDMNEDGENLRLEALQRKCQIKIGIVYGFSLEMKTVTFGVYCLLGSSR